jgi:exodeoxyribonuclease VII small subunit
MNEQSSYDRTRERLEEIVTQVKAKDVPLEKSLELYEEALRLGNRCAEMIDRTDFSAEELERAENVNAFEADEADAGGEADAANGAEAADVADGEIVYELSPEDVEAIEAADEPLDEDDE